MENNTAEEAPPQHHFILKLHLVNTGKHVEIRWAEVQKTIWKSSKIAIKYALNYYIQKMHEIFEK